ncbi:MAG: DUF5711 family protein [Acutalibacteraceae bacterium]
MKKKQGAGRYRNIDKKSNRKVVSYEDIPIDEYEVPTVPKHIFKNILKAIGIIFVSVAVLLVILNWNCLTSEQFANWFNYEFLGKSYGDGYPVRIVGTKVKSQNMTLINGGTLAYCSDTAILTLNSTAGEIMNEQHSFTTPYLKSSGNYMIVSSTGAKNYKILTSNSLVHTGTTDEKIFDADVSSNGRYAILTETDGYFSKLTAYLSDNREKYNYSFADNYAYALSLNNDGTKAAVAAINSENGSSSAIIYLLDFNSSECEAKYVFNDDYIYDICYLNNGNVVAVGASNAYFINVENQSKTTIEYNSATLTQYKLSKENGLLLSLSDTPDGKECSLMYIDKNGATKYRFSLGAKVDAIDLYSTSAVAVIQNKAYFYNENGSVISETECGRDTKQICMLNTNTAYALGNSEISMLTFN